MLVLLRIVAAGRKREQGYGYAVGVLMLLGIAAAGRGKRDGGVVQF